MKIIHVGLAIGLVLFCTGPLAAQNDHKPYEVETGTVSMRMEMLGVTLSITIQFDDYGRRQLTRLRGNAQGRTVSLNVLETRKYHLMWDDNTKRGDRRKIAGPPTGPLSLVSGLNLTAPRTPVDSTRSILGRECSGESSADGGVSAEFWRWKGIPLYVLVRGDNADVTFEAVKLDVATPLTSEAFDVPDDVTIIDQ